MLTSTHYRKLAAIVLWIGLIIVLCHCALAAVLTFIGSAVNTLPYPPSMPETPFFTLWIYLPALFSLNLAGTCLVGAFILWKVSRFKAEMESSTAKGARH